MVACVAARAGRAVGIEAQVHVRFVAKNCCTGDEIPDLSWQQIEGEQVQIFGAVALFAVASVMEAAQISAAFAGEEDFDLDAEKLSTIPDADVVFPAVAPNRRVVALLI